MRSRYSAFALGLEDYLRQSWHPNTRPSELLCDPDIHWVRLDVLPTGQVPAIESHSKAESPVASGYVRFRAIYRTGGKEGRRQTSSNVKWAQLEELSRFCQQEGKWVYLDGDANWAELKPARNSLCPCGSSKKFKRCCG